MQDRGSPSVTQRIHRIWSLELSDATVDKPSHRAPLWHRLNNNPMDKKAPKADTPKAGLVDEAAVMELEWN